LRIWKSNFPGSACGFAFLCDVLRDIDCNISIIMLPEYYDGYQLVDWGVLFPNKFFEFLPLERKMDHTEKIFYSDIWRRLKAENSTLRAIVNGKIMSVPENFYDCFILGSMPETDFVVASIYGAIINKFGLNLSDYWFLLRIEKMIHENKLKIVGEKYNHHFDVFGKIVRKV